MKRKILYGLCVLSIAFLSACSSGIKLRMIYPSHPLNKSYAIKESRACSVGSTIIRVERLFSIPTYVAKVKYNYKNYIILTPGQIWMAAATLEGASGNILVPAKDYDSFINHAPKSWGLYVDEDGKIKNVMFSAQGTQYNIANEPKEIAFEKITYASTVKGAFAAELIYSGVADNTLRLSYREYNEDMARPAFYQDLTYNLAESNIITFRSLKIKVTRADNSTIEYSVEEDGDLPWVPKY